MTELMDLPEGFRFIDSHHDGHGLNESIIIIANQEGPGGASHRYDVKINIGTEDSPIIMNLFEIQFQEGPRNVEGSIPGATEAALLAILIDRLKCFNAGPFSCRENAIMITKLEETLHWTKARADERAKRRVLGTYQK